MSSSIDDIKEQEADIFHELGTYDFQSEPLFRRAQETVKDKARQQLAVSADSPFSRPEFDEVEARRLKEERAALLRDETKEIRRQLDFVKSRLDELKTSGGLGSAPRNLNYEASQESINKPDSDEGQKSLALDRIEPPHGRRTLANINKINNKKHAVVNRRQEEKTKFRPLTGKADCPNCTCDRRSSVCDQCINFAIHGTPLISLVEFDNKNKSKNSSTRARSEKPKLVKGQDDERPIRPMLRDKNLEATERAAVEESVVPGKVYTISKSLNEKRTKLAQAIDDLHLMMDQVKNRGEKLDQERKLVQLYKEQWKYGPSIGGPRASPRDRLGISGGSSRRSQQQHHHSYESRLDPKLSRDSKSLMGFQHIDSTMKLRQYTKTPATPTRRNTTGPPKFASSVHARSRSLESFQKISSPGNKTTTGLYKAISNYRNGKPSSELNLASTQSGSLSHLEDDDEDEEEEEEVVEERIENEMKVDDSSAGAESQFNSDEQADVEGSLEPSNGSPADNSGQNGDSKATDQDDKSTKDEKMRRMTWIPVFGETEIKTVKRTPKRKLQIVEPDKKSGQSPPQARAPASGNFQTNVQKSTLKKTTQANKVRPTRGSAGQARQPVSGPNDKLMMEAGRKLKFATDLLEQEQRESSTKNQLVVVKRPAPAPRKRVNAPAQTTSNTATSKPIPSSSFEDEPRGAELSSTASEIIRLEEMVKEQQKLLARLVQAQDRQLLVSPISVNCGGAPSPCCHQTIPARPLGCGQSHQSHNRHIVGLGGGGRSLISTLRDRLNKSKMRLAHTLEGERAKHQQLKLRVDSSLRKQSDLENENELLKKSLSKCIDTCLRDISNTFESLNDTLNDSIINHDNDNNNNNNNRPENEIRPLVDGGSVLTNAAQLIADNRHLKQMKNHIETIERQRKGIFEELSKEKQRSNLLESQLKESQAELNRLAEVKQRLESQLLLPMGSKENLTSSSPSLIGKNPTEEESQSDPLTETERHKPIEIPECQPSTSSATKPTTSSSSESRKDTDKSDFDESYNSVDVYRRYIQSMSPDIESLQRERKLILNEFDMIKKMLTGMDT